MGGGREVVQHLDAARLNHNNTESILKRAGEGAQGGMLYFVTHTASTHPALLSLT